MTSQNLERLARSGELKAERISRREFLTLVNMGSRLLEDSRNAELSIESRFSLVYGAAHALASAALRWHGYRSESRYAVFQCLEHTAALTPAQWRVLSLCHDRRNKAEYDGVMDVEEGLVGEAIEIVSLLLKRVSELKPSP
jgi:hypothetical protein